MLHCVCLTRYEHTSSRLAALEAQMAIKGTSESQLAGLRKLAAVQRYQLRILQVRTRLARG